MIIFQLLIILLGLLLIGGGLIALAMMLPFLWAIYAVLGGMALLIWMGVISVD